jgi:hypothetical protein
VSQTGIGRRDIALLVFVAVCAALWWRGLSFDAVQAWRVDHNLIFGGPGYGAISYQSYPLPYVLLFLPIGLAPAGAAPWVGAVLAAAIVFAAIRVYDCPLWLLATLPAIGLITDTHILAATGLLGVCMVLRSTERSNWLMLGIGVALALIRPINALPVLVVVALATDRWLLLKAATVAIAVLGLLCLAAVAVDPRWIAEYQGYLRDYSSGGIFRLITANLGIVGLAVISVGVGVASAVVARRRRSDAICLAAAISVLVSAPAAAYSAAFAIPGLARLAHRPGLQQLPQMLAAATGVIFVVALLIPGDAFMPLVIYGFALLVLPIARAGTPLAEARHAAPAPS